MKFRHLLFGGILLHLSSKSLGQSTKSDSLFYPYKHGIYLEIIGNAETLLSLNYERILNANSRAKLHYSLRTGFGAYRRRQDSVWVFNFPFEFNFLYGRHKHYIESSIGYTASFGKHLVDSEYTPPAHFERYDHIYVFRLGYRYMYEGILVRLTPIYIYYPDFINKIMFRACISLGIAF
jgi:hypothetical protein